MLNNFNMWAGLLPVYFLSLLAIMVIVFLVSTKNKRKQQELDIAKELNKRYLTNHDFKSEPQLIVKPKHDEVIDSLNFMLQHQIITPEQYNKLLVACLPFLG